MTYKLVVAAAILAMGVPAHAKQSNGTGTFEETGAYWSNGELPKSFKLRITMTVEGDTLRYHGENTTDPAKPIVSDWSGKADGKVYPFNGGYFDQMAIHKVYEDQYLVEKYRGGELVIGEFWRFVPKTDQWIRHGVVAKSILPNGTKTYIEYFKRAGRK
ncbi:hypothetical protein OK349_04300 [Sphingomonas sp. BT-65]|uniref:hypothetical protein n=1 Tax=Sphingomonas sp. BT-65 TaxID=2989821 RepID=UPI002236BD0B|nr:hypothetical protein [Sphingomonas sp. BT-65]MCW4460916.1 hypothetical protein [Sphingomonas sp. BT-65]